MLAPLFIYQVHLLLMHMEMDVLAQKNLLNA